MGAEDGAGRFFCAARSRQSRRQTIAKDIKPSALCKTAFSSIALTLAKPSAHRERARPGGPEVGINVERNVWFWRLSRPQARWYGNLQSAPSAMRAPLSVLNSCVYFRVERIETLPRHRG